MSEIMNKHEYIPEQTVPEQAVPDLQPPIEEVPTGTVEAPIQEAPPVFMEPPVEEAPAVVDEEAMPPEGMDPARQEAELRTLSVLAQRSGARGPAARPGRFSPRRQGLIHSASGPAIREENEEASARRKASIDIYQSYVNKRVLTGRLVGVKDIYNRRTPDERGAMVYVGILQHGPFNIVIPANEFSDLDMEAFAETLRTRNPGRTVADATRIYLESRIGAEVDYVVTNLLGNEAELDSEEEVVASRKDAMSRNRIRYWFGMTTNNQPLVNIGDRARARVIAVTRRGIRIELFGVETFIPSSELSWSMIQDAATEYAVGTYVTVVIKDISRDEANDYAVSYEASVKAAKPDPRSAGLRLFTDGGIFHGTINYVSVADFNTPRARPGVFVSLAEGVQCLCPYPMGSVPPQRGAHCRVQITNHDNEKKYLFGRIIFIEPEQNAYV